MTATLLTSEGEVLAAMENAAAANQPIAFAAFEECGEDTEILLCGLCAIKMIQAEALFAVAAVSLSERCDMCALERAA